MGGHQTRLTSVSLAIALLLYIAGRAKGYGTAAAGTLGQSATSFKFEELCATAGAVPHWAARSSATQWFPAFSFDDSFQGRGFFAPHTLH